MSDALIAPAKCFVPVINMDRAFEKLHKREKDISAYKLIMSIADSPGNPAFQRKYTGFYRLRRNEEWRREYFRLMDFFGKSGEPTFEEILLCLYQATGNIECSFSSKMLATINPDMPIWDSKVLKALQLRLKGKDPETRISNAVVLYESICHWYEVFLQTKTGKDMIQRFDREFPKFKDMPVTKKVDFILWAS